MDVFDLFAKLSLDSSEYEDELNTAEKKGANFGKGLATAGKIAGGAVLAVGTAVAGVTTSLVKNAGEVAEYGDTIDKESQKLGISAEAYQEWSAILQHTGGSIDSLKPALKTLTKEIVDNSDAFQQLGISQEDIINKPIEDVLAMTITSLQGMEAGVERTRLATQLLGRSSVELGALLNTSAEDTEAMRQRVHELGGVLSNEAVKNAAGFQDALQDMQTAFSGIKNTMMAEFMPALTGVMDGLTAIFSGNYEDGAEQINSAVDMIIENVTEVMPKLLEVGVSIIESIATAVLENIPKLLPTIVDLVLNIAQFLVDNLPTLIKTAGQIIVQIALGIAKALPELIPTIVDVVLQIVDTLIDNIDLLIDAALQLIIGLAEGIIKALPKLIEKAPEIIIKLVEAIIRNLPKILEAGVQLIITLVKGIVDSIPKIVEGAGKIMTSFIDGIKNAISKVKEVAGNIIKAVKDAIFGKVEDAATWGKDLIANFVQGIKDKIGAVKEVVSSVADKIKGFLGFSEPEEGPLSNFHTYAPDMMKLFAQGVEENEDIVEDSVKKAFNFGDIIKASGDIDADATGRGGANVDLKQALTDAVRDALDGFEIDWNGKNLGRLIQKYA